MKLSFSATLLLMCASAWAQSTPFFYQPLGQVKDFLQLSDGQLQSIFTNNDEYNRWSSEKQTRISQVQTEIAQETAKDTLDPSALGIRYAEVETICREMKDRANEYRTRNQDVLSQDQKAKLKVLEDAMKLAPIISQAQGGNLIGGFSYPPLFFTSGSASISGSVIGSFLGPASGCYLPFPTAVMRNGDFSSAPNGNVVPANRTSAATPPVPQIATRWFNTKFFVTGVPNTADGAVLERNGRFTRRSVVGPLRIPGDKRVCKPMVLKKETSHGGRFRRHRIPQTSDEEAMSALDFPARESSESALKTVSIALRPRLLGFVKRRVYNRYA